MKAFHSFDLGEDEVINGVKPLELLRAEGEAVFKYGVQDQTVIDIGAWDGWYSFEAERLGASEVTASDWFCWDEGPGWGTREVFDHVHAHLGSNVKKLTVDIPELSPGTHGTYDVVLMLGVLYHVRDMLTTLERACNLSRRMIVVETAPIPDELPIARYWPVDSLHPSDYTNFWTPSTGLVCAMLTQFGFSRVEYTPTPMAHQGEDVTRHIFHAWRW